jgi:hypothetical protein
MVDHGEGPRAFFVKSHVRWLRGELRHVEGYFRMMAHPLGYRSSALQLAFGFMREGAA